MNLQQALACYCLKEKCLDKDSTINLDLKENILTMLQFVKTLHQQTKLKLHIPCAISLVNKVLIDICKTLQENIESDLLEKEKMNQITELLTIICVLPDICYPLKMMHDSETESEFELNHRMNPILVYECLKCYKQLILITTKKTDLIETYQRNVVSKTCSQLLILVCGRFGAFSWTNKNLKDECDFLLKFICGIAGHQNIKSLFSGNQDAQRKALFRDGILGNVLNNISLVFTKDNWRKNLSWKHSLIWSITKVQYPHLGRHIPVIIPKLLLLADDVVEENKLFGISMLLYTMNNVNPSDLNLHNYSQVIFELLFQQLYSSSDGVYEVTLPCLHKVLQFLEPNQTIGSVWTLWDKTIEKLIQNIEISNHIKTRQLFLKYLPSYITEMGVNILKHFNPLFKCMLFVARFTDTEGEQSRLLVLNVFKKIIVNGWVGISKTQKTKLLKIHVKIFLDIKFAEYLTNDQKLVDLFFQNMMLIRACSDKEFDESLKEILDTKTNEKHTKQLQSIVQSILTTNVNNYNFSIMK